MSLGTAEDDSGTEIHVPADIDWEMLDKSKFFFLGAALFSGVSGMLYPIVVLKTRKQVLVNDMPCLKLAVSISRHEGCRGFYKGFGTSLMGTIPARALYMGALEMTKSNVGCVTVKMGLSEAKAAAIANAAAGLSAAMAAQLVWTPIDVVSQRLMVQGGNSAHTSALTNKYVDSMGGEGYCVNVPWSRGGVSDNDYIFSFEHIVFPIAREFAPDFTIFSAGFDAARGDPLGCCDVYPAASVPRLSNRKLQQLCA
ncbi:hypothetical protein SSX86_030172 [Deinandra increscens subsp. villosa]|uniref:Histone deacetylase domain-containing protein n=1 Tax=Deinandra increscens subsp. villosa TaxID=3103831 RepID=A0AAP0CC26_9ASTR